MITDSSYIIVHYATNKLKNIQMYLTVMYLSGGDGTVALQMLPSSSAASVTNAEWPSIAGNGSTTTAIVPTSVPCFPRRPMHGYNFFIQEKYKIIKPTYPGWNGTAIQKIAHLWRNLSAEEKSVRKFSFFQ